MSATMPILFIGHGNPMNAIEDNEFSRVWISMGQQLPKPKTIIVISAHWQTSGIKVTGSEQPKQMYDFFGFPESLQRFQYPVKGDPQTAKQVARLLESYDAQLNDEWGIDHGAWSVLCRLFPDADIPVIQLSLDAAKSPAQHWQIAQLLQPLRQQDVLIIGSGNMVHNLSLVEWNTSGASWAIDFDTKVAQCIQDEQYDSLISYDKLPNWQLAIPTNEHYLPLLYCLALKQPAETTSFFADKVIMNSLSMRSLLIK